jgi:PIN domain nuclease of toxin-antitoxin system
LSFLLDTHALLWWLFDEPRLSEAAAARLREPENRILVSAASAWEIATKYRLGRLPAAAPLVTDFADWIRKARFEELPVSADHALRAGSWEVEHRDPFDRMLAAQSRIESTPLITRDPAFAAFGVRTLW